MTVSIEREHDVAAARQRARQIAALTGFDATEQTRVATAASEIARNAFVFAGGGTVEFFMTLDDVPQTLFVKVSDNGDGISNLTHVLEEQCSSKTGMGSGIVEARRLMDYFHIESNGDGTIVSLGKTLPAFAPLVNAERLSEIAAEMAKDLVDDPLAEIEKQNRELLQTLAQLNECQHELIKLNHELEDTNRGVVALYAELDEKAESLGRADITKTKFLSNVSHEFRTPLNAQIALTRILLDRLDGDLTEEQEKQVRLIRRSAENLLEMVNDLLDIAKIEAGKTDVQLQELEIGNLFSALRGILRPILNNDAVELVFEEPADIPALYTDEGKVSQILRNFLSNAIKFTEKGEIRVSAILSEKGESVIFRVSDTGIGIAPENQSRIFDEFTQIGNPLQHRIKGTGLGLPLCRKLADILGGTVSVESIPGTGSVFSAEIPVHFGGISPVATKGSVKRLLVIDDEEAMRHVYRKLFKEDEFEIIEANDGTAGLEMARSMQPDAICLDVKMPGIDGAEILTRLKNDSETRHIPVILVSSNFQLFNHKLNGKCAARLSKKDLSAEILRTAITEVLNKRI